MILKRKQKGCHRSRRIRRDFAPGRSTGDLTCLQKQPELIQPGYLFISAIKGQKNPLFTQATGWISWCKDHYIYFPLLQLIHYLDLQFYKLWFLHHITSCDEVIPGDASYLSGFAYLFGEAPRPPRTSLEVQRGLFNCFPTWFFSSDSLTYCASKSCLDDQGFSKMVLSRRLTGELWNTTVVCGSAGSLWGFIRLQRSLSLFGRIWFSTWFLSLLLTSSLCCWSGADVINFTVQKLRNSRLYRLYDYCCLKNLYFLYFLFYHNLPQKFLFIFDKSPSLSIMVWLSILGFIYWVHLMTLDSKKEEVSWRRVSLLHVQIDLGSFSS